MWVAVVAIAAGLAAFWPHPKPDHVVLLPAPDGTVGRVIVSTPKGEQEITQAYEVAATAPSGAIQTGSETAVHVKEHYGDALQAMPQRPASYILYFLNNSDQLTPESQATLAALTQDVVSRPVPEVAVIGYTDLVGSDEYNDALSQQRAQVVADMLRQANMKSQSLEIVGRGKRDPLVPTANGVAEPRNRRVEVSVR